MASSTSVMIADVISPRAACHTVAQIITIMMPAAAQGTSHG
jgi:hypothetical protein